MHQKTQERATNSLQISQTVKKLVLSSAVAVTFAAYAVHERTNTDGTDNSGSVGLLNTAKPNEVSAMPPFEPTATRTVQPAGTTRNNAQNLQPTAMPTQAPPTAAPSNGIKDGTYTGDSANAYYGNVQV